VIITSAGQPAGHAMDRPAHWTSLARRGMLWSDVQVFDVTTMAAKSIGPDLDPDCYELLYCVDGVAVLTALSGFSLRLLAGQVVVVGPSVGSVTVAAGSDGATLVRVRALPAATSRQLPPRRPSLDDERDVEEPDL
jgi:hypothetical protein